MNTPLLHPKTKTALNTYLERPTHGLLLSGQSGTGKLFTAQWLAEQSDQSYYVLEKPEDKSTIAIEQIRELYNVTRSGTPLTIIIKDSHLLGREAQNAFLKLLEEPPQNTRFILTTDSPHALLQTIHSRTQSIEILKPEPAALKRLAGEHLHLSSPEFDALVLTTEGRVGEIFRLITDDELLESHLQRVTEAKQFYIADAYSRHVMCQHHAYDKEWAINLLKLLAIIMSSLIKRSYDNNPMLQRLTKQAKLIEEVSYRLLQINGNPKIHLAKLSECL